MTIIVIYYFQTVHIYKHNHNFAVFCDTLFEDFIRSTNKTVSVINIAQWVNDIELIKFRNSSIELMQLSYIFNGVAYVQKKRVTQHTFNRKFTVDKNAVSKTSFTKMYREEIAYITAMFKFFRKHFFAAEKFNLLFDSIFPHKRSTHTFGIA